MVLVLSTGETLARPIDPSWVLSIPEVVSQGRWKGPKAGPWQERGLGATGVLAGQRWEEAARQGQAQLLWAEDS